MGIPTFRSIATASAAAAALESLWWRRITSMIWLPTEYTGEKLVMGSWKTMAISLPRIARISGPLGSRVARSTGPASLWSTMLPPAMTPFRGTMRRIDCDVTLLPQPDSPTMPSTRPRLTSKETPSTARSVPSREMKWVSRPRTSRSTSRFAVAPSCARSLMAAP